MNHPLLPQLQTLSQLLTSQPQFATSREAVKALDKVSTATRAAIDLLQGAAAGSTPEAQELQRLLEQAFGKYATDKAVKALLKPLLTKPPAHKAGTSLGHYLTVLVQATVQSGSRGARAACLLVRKHLDAQRFDASTKDEYELLKQIRQLGQMDVQQKKAAKAYLLNQPELVARLCVAASIPTATGKVRKSISMTSLVNKLIQHGERYAENAGS